MPVVKRIRNRGATLTVESHAEVLFMPSGSVNTWANRFTGRIRSAAEAAAPTNKRPRWAHYGKPLKETIVSARPRFWSNGKDKQRVYAAVGSTAPYAYYVDQGTGVFNGSGPYPAKILPPWQHGSPSLYEATWRPIGPQGRRVAPVMIKGQKGQQFFDKALRAAFQSMRMRSAQLPGEGGPKITDALNSVPTGLENFLGNTPVSPAFTEQLDEWRKWRDDAWENHEGLGRGGGVGSAMHARYWAQAAAAREAALAAEGRGMAAYLASVEAAEKRKREQIAEIRAKEKRKKEGKRKRKEKEAKDRAKADLKAGNSKMRRESLEFFRLVRLQYRDAKWGQQLLSDGTILFQVKYTGPDGKVHSEKWNYDG